jgi:hypothetical protein
MWMMQVRPDGVIDVVAVRNAIVPTIGPVRVTAGVLDTAVRRRARRWIRGSDCHAMLIDMIPVHVVQVTVVDVVGVIFVLDGLVSAALAVRVTVLGMCLACHTAPPVCPGRADRTAAQSL